MDAYIYRYSINASTPTNHIFYQILYYRDFTSRYISYRVVYSILIGAGYIYKYIYVYMYVCMYVCICIYIYIYIPANACYFVYMIICMFFMCAHFMYADFIKLLFYPWLLGQRWTNEEIQTNIRKPGPHICLFTIIYTTEWLRQPKSSQYITLYYWCVVFIKPKLTHWYPCLNKKCHYFCTGVK